MPMSETPDNPLRETYDRENIPVERPLKQIIHAEGGSTVSNIIQASGDVHIDRVEYTAPPIIISGVAPIPPTHFVGREPELESIAQIISENTSHITIALQGMGGVGKTSLITKLVVATQKTFTGGCFWADMASYNGDPFPILEGWGRLCGLISIGQVGDPINVVRAALSAHIERNGRLIVVLDDIRPNWLEGARLLKKALPEQATLILTTRDEEIALFFADHVFRLDVLPLQKALEMLHNYNGIFNETEIHFLANRVGCLPLALELLNKLVIRYMHKPGWDPGLFLSEFEGGMSESLKIKDHSVYNAFNISYRDLTSEQRYLFRLLGIFAPGQFTADWVTYLLETFSHNSVQQTIARKKAWANEQIQMNSKQQDFVIHQLDELVSLSLVQWAESGYRLHPLLRDYAVTELRRTDGYEQATRAHAELFLAFCRANQNDYEMLERARTNILMGMDTAFELQDWDAVRCYMWGLGADGRYMVAHGYWHELQKRLPQAIIAARAENMERDVAAFNVNLGIAAQHLWNYPQAEEAFNKALQIGQSLSDPYITTHALHQLGVVAQASGNPEQAQTAYQNSLYLKKSIGDKRGMANSLAQLATLARQKGNDSAASTLYEQSLELFTKLDNVRGMAAVRHQMGGIALIQKQYKIAEMNYRESLYLREMVNDKRGIAAVHHQLGVLAQKQRDYDAAQSEYLISLKLKQEIGDEYGIALTESNLGVLSYIKGEYELSREFYNQSINIFRRLRDKKKESEVQNLLSHLDQIKK